MNYVYILKSIQKNWTYIGCCDDLKQRFSQHNAGRVRSTKARCPYRLVYYEAYGDITLARKREYELKNNSSKKEQLFRRIFL